MKINLEILQKIVRFWFFFADQTPFQSRELNTNLLPRAYSRFKMADRRGKNDVIITARYKKVASTAFFFISLSLYGTSIARKYSIFIQQLSLLHFRKIFPKNPWNLEPCRETARNDKKSWDSRQNRESWQVCSVVQMLTIGAFTVTTAERSVSEQGHRAGNCKMVSFKEKWKTPNLHTP